MEKLYYNGKEVVAITSPNDMSSCQGCVFDDKIVCELLYMVQSGSYEKKWSCVKKDKYIIYVNKEKWIYEENLPNKPYCWRCEN